MSSGISGSWLTGAAIQVLNPVIDVHWPNTLAAALVLGLLVVPYIAISCFILHKNCSRNSHSVSFQWNRCGEYSRFAAHFFFPSFRSFFILLLVCYLLSVDVWMSDVSLDGILQFNSLAAHDLCLFDCLCLTGTSCFRVYLSYRHCAAVVARTCRLIQAIQRNSQDRLRITATSLPAQLTCKSNSEQTKEIACTKVIHPTLKTLGCYRSTS